ncbi:MAG TPA: hypothetical protein VK206_22300 [Anaerolineales bacterium]|nr:hypothetical protein [Anaerolineales bacterium]
MKKSRIDIPIYLLFIAVFYVFGAIGLVIFLFADPIQASSAMAKVHGLPASTGVWILPLIAGLALLISYGLFSLSRWGYTLTMLYLAYFGIVSGSLLRTHNDPVYLGNLMWSIFVIIYLILVRNRFQPR